MRYLVFLLLLCRGASVGAQSAPTIELKRGLVITRSVRVVPKVYRLAAAASLDSSVITIRGDDVTVDFGGASLVGLDRDADPDRAAGVGIRIEGGRNVRIENAVVRGFKVGLLARNTRRLSLVANDFSYNWKPRLFSVLEHESLVDWLSHHKNDTGEWLRFGAGIYLDGVTGGDVRDNRITQGMEGLMLVRSDSLRIWNNTIEFNSGVGIGLYRSSDNRIMHNRASYNVRGYSHGFYRRGQDSADLLIYEQSCRNIVAYNSMTHGGDGLFLWAGQSTMDTGEGGANDNLFFSNDFSFAPTNGMEATFSRNTFVGNRVEGSDYGLWGGYSYDSQIVGNEFVNNRTGIAIEHGQKNNVVANHFTGDTVAVSLWANAIEPSDWGYPKHRDTRSRDYFIGDNTFIGNRVGIRAQNTRASVTARNAYSNVDSQLVQRDSVELRDDPAARRQPSAATSPAPAPLPGAIDARLLDTLARRDRSAIIVTEWGPYDRRSPLLWPIDSTRAGPVRLRVLGPAGTWRVIGRRRVSRVSSDRGRVGDTIAVTPAAGGEWELRLEYRGTATISPRGMIRRAGEPYEFSYSRLEATDPWDVRFFGWDVRADPRKDAGAIERLARGAPVATTRPGRLDYLWYRPTVPGVPQDHWAAVATTRLSLGPGTYSVRTISDDGIRVWIDGRLAIDHLAPHESEVDYAPIAPGRHELRVEYYQVAGWTELRLDVVRGMPRSAGSPGPH